MTDLVKLSQSNESVRTTIPKDALVELGIVDENGELDGDHWLKFRVDGDTMAVDVVSP